MHLHPLLFYIKVADRNVPKTCTHTDTLNAMSVYTLVGFPHTPLPLTLSRLALEDMSDGTQGVRLLAAFFNDADATEVTEATDAPHSDVDVFSVVLVVELQDDDALLPDPDSYLHSHNERHPSLEWILTRH